jgi:hydrogenase/urease accessory protein HupE
MIARILALLGNVTFWAGYAFMTLCLALLVYAVSQGGARDVATWVITVGVGVTAVIIGYAIRYILGGNQQA